MVAVAAMSAAFVLALSTAVRAATITVNSLADPGAAGICALRDAITAANSKTATNGCAAGSGSDTIQFSVTGTIPLASTLPQVTDSLLIINGPASPGITIDGGGKVQVMQVTAVATLKLNRLTIADGFALAPSFPELGGGIGNEGALTVTNSTFSGNIVAEGIAGGIFNDGRLNVTNSTFSGNSADNSGGGISSDGTLTVTNSTFSGNSTAFDGGGIFSNGTTLTVANSIFSGNVAQDGAGIENLATATVTKSTFSGNGAVFGGGGIETFGTLAVTQSTFSGNSVETGGTGGGISSGGTLAVTNSTFSGNDAETGGGISSGGTLAVSNSTFSGNSSRSGGGIFNDADASFKNTILAASSGGNCAGTITDAGYNISDDNTCGFAKTGSANNGDNVNPLLSPAGLANNGGPTQTIALQSGSPAIDSIPVADCTDQSIPPKRITTDQRGFPRPDAGEQVCDIGAYEFQDFAGRPGKPNCQGKSVSALAHQFGSIKAAASALHFPSVRALQNAIRAFCGE